MWLLTNRRKGRKSWTDEVDPVKGFRFFRVNGDPTDVKQVQEVPLSKAVGELLAHGEQCTPNGQLGHVCINVHGYNNSLIQAWERSGGFFDRLEGNGYSCARICVSWPSDASLFQYVGDREDARRSFPSFMSLLVQLDESFRLGNQHCKNLVNLVAHSMGCQLMRDTFTAMYNHLRKPQALPAFNEVLLVGADIDADSLNPGNSGEGVAKLSRRVTVYYNRHDAALLASQGLKSGGSRRLGRSGIADWSKVDARVTAVDCSEAIPPEGLTGGIEVHGAYFTHTGCLTDMTKTLQSVDRRLIPGREMVERTDERGFKMIPS